MDLSSRVRVGILGGTFNPIHNQHLLLAKCAYEQLMLKKVLVIPSGVSYLKAGTNVLPAGIRYDMCMVATKGIPYLEVSDIEIKRQGNSYTRDTLKELLEEDPDRTLYYIIGADTLMMLDKWRDPEYIFRHCVITVASRPGGDRYSDDMIKEKISQYETVYSAEIERIDIEISGLSSSMIRESASRGEDISAYVPSELASYIREHNLYK